VANIFEQTCYRKPGNGVENDEGSPTISRNFMNFGPQTNKK